MPGALPELTQRQIQKVWKTTDQSRREIALPCGVSESTVKRLTQGLKREPAAACATVVSAALANGAVVTIDGMTVTQYVGEPLWPWRRNCPTSPPKAKKAWRGHCCDTWSFMHGYICQKWKPWWINCWSTQTLNPKRFLTCSKDAMPGDSLATEPLRLAGKVFRHFSPLKNGHFG